MGTSDHKRLFGEAVDMLAECSPDELRVHHRALSRSRGARKQYGALVLATDPRHMRGEAADEFCDAIFYMCAYEVAREDQRRERVRCFAADEASARVESAMASMIDEVD